MYFNPWTYEGGGGGGGGGGVGCHHPLRIFEFFPRQKNINT